ncbi:MAG: hypothetical protein IK027_03965 [Deltaproteobacteria bacterium]|nr:hypothetical protein [Deltaproteobacteria bacterium]
MKFFCMVIAALFSIMPVAARADDISDKLDGTWIETRQIKDCRRTVLHFNGRNLRVENMFDKEISVEYTITEKKADEFSISFEYRHKVKRGNGRIVEYREAPEFLFHVENGRPILSQMVIEFDGRGLIVWNEYLRKENFADGFESELRKKLNNRPAPPMMKE